MGVCGQGTSSSTDKTEGKEDPWLLMSARDMSMREREEMIRQIRKRLEEKRKKKKEERYKRK